LASKTPRAEIFPNINQLKPAWRIGRLEMCEPFGWRDLERSKLQEIRARLSELEKLTWNEILVQNKYWNHTIQVGDLCSEAQERLLDLRLDDYDEIVSLRLSNLERIWGLRIDGAMTLLWWDPDHSICPSLKT
jgi:hypothetical protein